MTDRCPRCGSVDHLDHPANFWSLLSDEDVERIAEAVVAKLQPPVAGVVTGPDQAVIWRPDGAWETRSKPEPT